MSLYTAPELPDFKNQVIGSRTRLCINPCDNGSDWNLFQIISEICNQFIHLCCVTNACLASEFVENPPEGSFELGSVLPSVLPSFFPTVFLELPHLVFSEALYGVRVAYEDVLDRGRFFENIPFRQK